MLTSKKRSNYQIIIILYIITYQITLIMCELPQRIIEKITETQIVNKTFACR